MSNTERTTPRNRFGRINRTVGWSAALIAIVALVLAMACNGGDQPTSETSSEREGATPIPTGAQQQEQTGSEPTGAQQAAAPSSQADQSSDTTAAASTRTTDAAASAQQNQPSDSTAPATQQTPGNSQADTEAPATAEQIAHSEELSRLANSVARRGRYHRSLILLEEALEANPASIEAHTMRASLTTLSGDPQKGLDQVNATLAMDGAPQSSLYALRSYVHSELEDYNQALQDADTAREHFDWDSDSIHPDTVEMLTARFVALYRTGDYATIQNELWELDQNRESWYEPEVSSGEPLRPFGLFHAYQSVQWNTIQSVGEADTNILLNPEQWYQYSNRAGNHANLKWDAMAVQDYAKAAEMTKEAQESHKINLRRAQALMRLGRYQEVVANADQLGPTSQIEVSIILAMAHWRVGDTAAASQVLDSFDYSDHNALDDPSGRVGHQLQTHLGLKGAMKAVDGDLEEALRYLYVHTCTERFSQTPADQWPDVRYRNDIIRSFNKLADDAVYAEEQGYEWATKDQASEIWQWCDYPSELADNPATAAYVSAAMPTNQERRQAAGPIKNAHEIFAFNHDFTDPIVLQSTNANLAHYMAAWTQMITWQYAITKADAERAIQMDATQPNTHRVLAETLISMAGRGRPDERLYELAQDTYARYEALESPESWEAARYHFTRGKTLSRLDNLQEAQKALAQAAQLGYPEDDVREALNELNQ